MPSLIKRDVNIAITPHIELIQNLVLDGLEMSNFHTQCEERVITKTYLMNNAIYYRFMRRTGHSTALRSMMKLETMSILSVFHGHAHATEFIKGIKLPPKSSFVCELDIERNHFKGLEIDVLVLNDYLSSDKLGKGKDIAEKLIEMLPNIKLVVFLG